MSIRDLTKSKSGTHHHLNDQAVTNKEFGKQDNHGKDSMTWHNRVYDWYNAERRFIFAAPNKKAMNKWISLIENEKKKIIIKENAEKNKMLGQFSDRVKILTNQTDTGLKYRGSPHHQSNNINATPDPANSYQNDHTTTPIQNGEYQLYDNGGEITSQAYPTTDIKDFDISQ